MQAAAGEGTDGAGADEMNPLLDFVGGDLGRGKLALQPLFRCSESGL